MGHFAAVVTSTVCKTPILKMSNSVCYMWAAVLLLGPVYFVQTPALQFDSLTNFVTINVSSILKVTVCFGCFRFLTFYFNFSGYDPFKNVTSKQLW